jgi:hypothetical protein
MQLLDFLEKTATENCSAIAKCYEAEDFDSATEIMCGTSQEDLYETGFQDGRIGLAREIIDFLSVGKKGQQT